MRAAVALLLIGCAMNGEARPGPVELKNAPVTVSLKLDHGRDSSRHLMLRIEGISVEGEVAVWEVRAGAAVAGTLATYGVQEQQGTYVAEVPLDAVVPRDARAVTITFVPTAQATGTIRLQRLRLIEQ